MENRKKTDENFEIKIGKKKKTDVKNWGKKMEKR